MKITWNTFLTLIIGLTFKNHEIPRNRPLNSLTKLCCPQFEKNRDNILHFLEGKDHKASTTNWLVFEGFLAPLCDWSSLCHRYLAPKIPTSKNSLILCVPSKHELLIKAKNFATNNGTVPSRLACDFDLQITSVVQATCHKFRARK